MAVDGNIAHAVKQLESPPGMPNTAYMLPSPRGEEIYIPCSKSVMRLLATGKEMDNAFAVSGTGGTAAEPIGLHFHRETHDVFLCLEGQVNVWAGEKCRTMGPGDFASVPPVCHLDCPNKGLCRKRPVADICLHGNLTHQYQILGER